LLKANIAHHHFSITTSISEVSTWLVMSPIPVCPFLNNSALQSDQWTYYLRFVIKWSIFLHQSSLR